MYNKDALTGIVKKYYRQSLHLSKDFQSAPNLNLKAQQKENWVNCVWEVYVRKYTLPGSEVIDFGHNV